MFTPNLPTIEREKKNEERESVRLRFQPRINGERNDSFEIATSIY